MSCNCFQVVEHSVVEVSFSPHTPHTHPTHTPHTPHTPTPPIHTPHTLTHPTHPHTYRCVQKVIEAGADISIHDDEVLTTVYLHGYDVQLCQASPLMLFMTLAPLLLSPPPPTDHLTLILPDSLQWKYCTPHSFYPQSPSQVPHSNPTVTPTSTPTTSATSILLAG